MIDLRRRQYQDRTGRALTDDNVWIHARLRELTSLDAIIERLDTDAPEPDAASAAGAVAGAGTGPRLPLLQIQTRGSHDSTLQSAGRTGSDQP